MVERPTVGGEACRWWIGLKIVERSTDGGEACRWLRGL
jgi:hypothetical protein